MPDNQKTLALIEFLKTLDFVTLSVDEADGMLSDEHMALMEKRLNGPKENFISAEESIKRLRNIQ
jgi:hypothetical protein